MRNKTKGEIIRETRKAEGFTQSELARLCGVDTSLISAVELGKRNPTLSFLDKISSVLEFEDDSISLYFSKETELGTILKLLRKKEKISQKSICDYVGLSMRMLNKIENNERLISEVKLRKFVEKLNVQNNKYIMNTINAAYEKEKQKFLSFYNGDIIKVQSIVLDLSYSEIAETLGISKDRLYSFKHGESKLLLIKISAQLTELLKFDINYLWVYLNRCNN